MIIRHLSIDCAYINKVLEPITQREHGVTEFEIEAKITVLILTFQNVC